MEFSRLRYHDLMLVLVYEIDLLWAYFGNDSKYKALLRELKKYDVDDYNPLPKQKELLSTLNMTRTQLMSLMHELYDDLNRVLSDPKAYRISETQIFICIETRDEDYWTIGVDGLKFIPMQCENITIPFVRGETAWGYFHVRYVTHEIVKGKHIINIFVSDTFDAEQTN